MKKVKGNALVKILVFVLIIAVLAFGVWYILTHFGGGIGFGSGSGDDDSVQVINTNVETSDTTSETTQSSITEEGIINITISGNTIKVDNTEQSDIEAFDSCISKYDKEKFKFRLLDDNAIVQTYDEAKARLEKYEFEIIEEKTLSEYESEINK